MFYHRRRNVFSSIILFMCCRLHVSLLARIYLLPRVSSSDAMINTEHGGGKKSISVPNCIKFVQLGCEAHYVVYIPIRNPKRRGGLRQALRLRRWIRIPIEYLPASAITECWFRDLLFVQPRESILRQAFSCRNVCNSL